jgi:phosphatidylglycerol---prolipoprotein diacylglyceryl transferase
MYLPIAPSFQLGPLTIHWYALTMLTAIFMGGYVASRYVMRKGFDGDSIWDMLLWVVIPAIIGARLYYVFIQSPRGPDGLGFYLSHPFEIIAVWKGGIHIYGAFIFGGIALLLYAYLKKLPRLIYLDAVGLALPLAQAIGRIGNFINQELYGPPTTLPWGLRIDPAHRIAPYNNLTLYPESVRFQPLFLYEMLWNLIGFALLLWISRRFEKRLLNGDIFLLYVIWYPLGRFFLEFLRTDSWFFPGTPFNVVHLASAIVIIAASVVFFIRHRHHDATKVAQSEATTPEAAIEDSGTPASEMVVEDNNATISEEVAGDNGVTVPETVAEDNDVAPRDAQVEG